MLFDVVLIGNEKLQCCKKETSLNNTSPFLTKTNKLSAQKVNSVISNNSK